MKAKRVLFILTDNNATTVKIQGEYSITGIRVGYIHE